MAARNANSVDLETMLRMTNFLIGARPRYSHLIPLLWFTGGRINETSKLDWIDFEHPPGSFPRVKFRASNTKNHVERVVPIPVDAYLQIRSRAYTGQLTGPIFSSTKLMWDGSTAHEPPTAHTLATWIRKAAAHVGQPKISAHTFRHAYATRVLRCTNLRVAQMLLGHKAVSTTANYTHPTLEDLANAVAEAFHAPLMTGDRTGILETTLPTTL